ncbi:hypothetical protein PsorP6_006262 [Peronosclerospora sorghi]|uniref:Uncharacterized protein n=1 Tax=Peronosclerospora sorghi TaxID=230839 RepID=A0ACC0W0T0_9STRA|nr:hypothetical protein PsorP6_006262 [Peronosclerospora sorghi]
MRCDGLKTKIQTLIHKRIQEAYREYRVAYASELTMEVIAQIKWRSDLSRMQSFLGLVARNPLAQFRPFSNRLICTLTDIHALGEVRWIPDDCVNDLAQLGWNGNRLLFLLSHLYYDPFTNKPPQGHRTVWNPYPVSRADAIKVRFSFME